STRAPSARWEWRVTRCVGLRHARARAGAFTPPRRFASVATGRHVDWRALGAERLVQRRERPSDVATAEEVHVNEEVVELVDRPTHPVVPLLQRPRLLVTPEECRPEPAEQLRHREIDLAVAVRAGGIDE